ncbi:hypothetical protein V8E54_009949, partial [Elaphomyces granulatus]
MMRSYIGDIEEIQAHFDTLMSLTTTPRTRYTVNIPPFFWRPASVVLETSRTARSTTSAHLVTFSLQAENHLATFPPPYPSFQVLHKSTIVHIASSQKDSGCPGVEVEVGIPATERDKGDRELETADCAVLSRRGFMFAQWKPCPDLPPQPC